jgi:phage shock protein A
VYYIVGGEKEGYVRTVMNALEEEIQEVTSTRTMVEAAVGDDLGFDLSVYEDIFNAMKANVDAGDYVSAMNDYASYDPAWKDTLVNALLYRITLLEDDVGTAHTELENLTELYQQLSMDAAALTTEYENITANYMTENESLKARLSSATTNTYVYQLVIVVLLAASVYLVVRFMRGDQKPTFKV